VCAIVELRIRTVTTGTGADSDPGSTPPSCRSSRNHDDGGDVDSDHSEAGGVSQPVAVGEIKLMT